jgi:ADP-ribose pyrophosphatase
MSVSGRASMTGACQAKKNMKGGSTMLVYEGKFMNVRMRNNWEFVERKGMTGIAGILAVTNDQKLVLIEQYREPVEKVCVEIPAGLIGDEDSNEAFLDGANRELEEETGYRAGKMSKIGDYPLSPGLSTEVMTLVLATDLEKVGSGGGDQHEDIKVIEIPLMTAPTEIMKLEEGGKKYIDAKVFLAAYFAYQEITRRLAQGELSYKDALKSIV